MAAETYNEMVAALESDPDIDEFGFYGGEAGAVVLMEHKLGLAMAAIQPLLEYATALHQRARQHWDITAAAAGSASNPSPDVLAAAPAVSHVLCPPAVVLLINGYYYTGWNDRKRLVQCGVVNPIAELKFVHLALTKHPKSDHLAQKLYAKNYHCWSQRQWLTTAVVAEHASCAARRSTKTGVAELTDDVVAEVARMLRQEYQHAVGWCKANPSDYGAAHHSRFVLTALSGVLAPKHQNLWQKLARGDWEDWDALPLQKTRRRTEGADNGGCGGDEGGTHLHAGGYSGGAAIERGAEDTDAVCAMWDQHTRLVAGKCVRYPDLTSPLSDLALTTCTEVRLAIDNSKGSWNETTHGMWENAVDSALADALRANGRLDEQECAAPLLDHCWLRLKAAAFFASTPPAVQTQGHR
eukprot:gene958-31703_t